MNLHSERRGYRVTHSFRQVRRLTILAICVPDCSHLRRIRLTNISRVNVNHPKGVEGRDLKPGCGGGVGCVWGGTYVGVGVYHQGPCYV